MAVSLPSTKARLLASSRSSQLTGEVAQLIPTSRAASMPLLSSWKKTSQTDTPLMEKSRELLVRAQRFLSLGLRSTRWSCQRPTTALLWVSTSALDPKVRLAPLLLTAWWQPPSKRRLTKECRSSWEDLRGRSKAGTTTSSPFQSTTPKSTLPWEFLSSRSDYCRYRNASLDYLYAKLLRQLPI